jgi:hypothetical protein
MSGLRLLGAALLVVAIGAAAYVLSGSTTGVHEPQTLHFSLQILDKKIVTGSGRLQARVGDSVTITVVSNEAEEFHVHGYDRSIDLAPDVPASVTFITDSSGRFMFELERSKIELGALEVLP